jgi:hypothetical protein
MTPPDPAAFSPEAFDAIAGALPPEACSRRLKLLPSILGEWAAIDLPRHWDFSSESQAVARRRDAQVAALGLAAKRLIEAFTALDDIGLWEVAFWTEHLRIGKTFPGLDHVAVAEGIERRKVGEEWLGTLARACHERANPRTSRRGRPKALTSYLVMLDLQAIFEFETSTAATRRVHGLDHPDSGAEYGPFFEFARAVWPLVFGSETGVSAAMKNWAPAQRNYGERSALIANVALRHPEWGLFTEEG